MQPKTKICMHKFFLEKVCLSTNFDLRLKQKIFWGNFKITSVAIKKLCRHQKKCLSYKFHIGIV